MRGGGGGVGAFRHETHKPRSGRAQSQTRGGGHPCGWTPPPRWAQRAKTPRAAPPRWWWVPGRPERAWRALRQPCLAAAAAPCGAAPSARSHWWQAAPTRQPCPLLALGRWRRRWPLPRPLPAFRLRQLLAASHPLTLWHLPPARHRLRQSRPPALLCRLGALLCRARCLLRPLERCLLLVCHSCQLPLPARRRPQREVETHSPPPLPPLGK